MSFHFQSESTTMSTLKLSEAASTPAVVPQLIQLKYSSNPPLSQNQSTTVCSLQHSEPINQDEKNSKKAAQHLNKFCISLCQRKWNEFLRRRVEVGCWTTSAKTKKNMREGAIPTEKMSEKIMVIRRGYEKYRVSKTSSLRWQMEEKASVRGREIMIYAIMNRVDDVEYVWEVPKEENELSISPQSAAIEAAKEKYERKEDKRKAKEAKWNARLRSEARCLQKRHERYGAFRSSLLAGGSNSDLEKQGLPNSLLEDQYLKQLRLKCGSASSRAILELYRIRKFTRSQRFGTFWWRHSEVNKRQIYSMLRSSC